MYLVKVEALIIRKGFGVYCLCYTLNPDLDPTYTLNRIIRNPHKIELVIMKAPMLSFGAKAHTTWAQTLRVAAQVAQERVSAWACVCVGS